MTFSRRPVARLNRGRVATPSTASGPSSFGTLKFYFDPRPSKGGATYSGTDLVAATDLSGNGHAITVLGAPQYEATGWNGTTESLLSDGAADGLSIPSLAALAAGTKTPLWVVEVLQIVTPTTGATVWSFGWSTSTSINYWRNLINSLNRVNVQRRDSVAGVLSVNTANNIFGASSPYLRQIVQSSVYDDAGTFRTSVDWGGGVIDPDGTACNDTGAMNCDLFVINGRCGGGSITNFLNCRRGPFLVYSSQPDLAALRAWAATEGY